MEQELHLQKQFLPLPDLKSLLKDLRLHFPDEHKALIIEEYESLRFDSEKSKRVSNQQLDGETAVKVARYFQAKYMSSWKPVFKYHIENGLLQPILDEISRTEPPTNVKVKRSEKRLWKKGLPLLLCFHRILKKFELSPEDETSKNLVAVFLNDGEGKMNWLGPLILLCNILDTLAELGYLSQRIEHINAEIASRFLCNGAPLDKNNIKSLRGKHIGKKNADFHDQIIEQFLIEAKRLEEDDKR